MFIRWFSITKIRHVNTKCNQTAQGGSAKFKFQRHFPNTISNLHSNLYNILGYLFDQKVKSHYSSHWFKIPINAAFNKSRQTDVLWTFWEGF